ncbi:unnamed protein product [Sympodiomycopsis kandeliae]
MASSGAAVAAAVQAYVNSSPSPTAPYTSSPSTASHSSSSSSSSSSSRSNALQSILAAGPAPTLFSSIDSQQRRAFALVLLQDLRLIGKAESHHDDQANHNYYRSMILKSLKELSRLPGGSLVQSEPTALRALLDQVIVPPVPSSDSLTSPSNSSSSSSSTDSRSTNNSQKGLAGVMKRAFNRDTPKGSSEKAPRRRPATSHTSRSKSTPTSGYLTPTPAYVSATALLRQSTQTIRNRSSSHSSSSSLSSSVTAPSQIQWEITDLALRCINNALYLHETSRSSFADDQVGGGRKAIQLLMNPWQTPAEILFLACRLLFFATLFEASFNAVALQEQALSDRLKETLDALSVSLVNIQNLQLQHNDGTNGGSSVKDVSTSLTPPLHNIGPPGTEDQIKAAMAELLKVAFNIGLYCSRTDDETKKESKLATLIDPVLRLMIILPTESLASPASNAIGVLLNFSVKENKQKWLSPTVLVAGSTAQEKAQNGKGKAKRVAKAIFGGKNAASTSTLSLNTSDHGSPDVERASMHSTAPSTSSSQAPVLHAAIMPTSASTGSTASTIRRDWETVSLADAASEEGSVSSVTSVVSPTLVIEHVVSFLTSFLDKYFAPFAHGSSSNGSASSSSLDCDDPRTRSLAEGDKIDIEGACQPLCLLLRNLAAEDDELRRTIKRDLLPDQMDRSVAPDRRADSTGRLIRLMSSVCYTRLSQVAGELLLALCKSDAKTMVNEIGYGPCAGFLVSKGLIGSLPEGPPPSSTSSEGRSINPITGQYDPSSQETATDPINNMTEEEKEAEADRLFDLFDRLNRNGVISVQNPMQNMTSEQGKIMEVKEEEEQSRRTEKEEREEEEILNEFSKYKNRNGSKQVSQSTVYRP